MVKWTGKVQYEYDSLRNEGQKRDNDNTLLFRLEPTAEINPHWHAVARLDAKTNTKDDTSATVTLKRAYVQGDYDKFQVRLGKMALSSSEGYQAPGNLILDSTFTGAQLSFGDEFKAKLEAGRLSDGFTDTANYQSAQVRYDKNKFMSGVGFYRLGSSDLTTKTTNKKERAHIWGADLGYRFVKNSFLSGSYAHANKYSLGNKQKKAYQFTYEYKGADQADKGSWGAYVSYRYLGKGAAPLATTDGAQLGSKGVEFGLGYVPYKNVLLSAKYFKGKTIEKQDNDKVQKLYGSVEFFF